MRSSKGLALIAVNLAALIFGSTALFGRLEVSAIWIVAVRGVFAAAVLALIILIRRNPLTLSRPLLWRALLTGVLLAIHWVTFFLAVKLASVAIATLTFATFPFWTVTLTALRQRKLPRAHDLIPCAGIVIAVLLIVDLRDATIAGLDPSLLGFGILAGLASAICFAIFSLASQTLIGASHMTTLSLYQNIAVALVLLPFLPFDSAAPTTAFDWAALAALGLAATALAHQLYFFSLKFLPASVCGSFVCLEPVYAIVLATLILGDAVNWQMIAAGVLIVGSSLALLWRTERTAGQPPAAPG